MAEPPPGLYAAAVALLAGSHDVVLLHVPRGCDDIHRTATRLADRTVIVGLADAFSLYGVTSLVPRSKEQTAPERWALVVNRARRGRRRVRDFQFISRMAPSAVIREDSAVPRCQDRGELLGRRSRRAGRDVRRLASLLFADVGSRREP